MRHVFLRAILLLLVLATPPLSAAAGEITFDPLPFGDSPLLPGLSPQPAAQLTATATPESTAIAAGVPFKLLLTLDHKSGSYSYWTNPGGPGMGTRVTWALPEGFSISGPEMPAPELYQNGGMTFYVYKGRVSFVYTVTPPSSLKTGSRHTLRADIDTQVCTTRTCTPLRLEVAGGVIAAPQQGASDPAVAGAQRLLPSAPGGWRFDAADYDGEIVIGMYPPAGTDGDPGEVYFFDSGARPFVDSQKKQRLEKGHDGWWLRLPRLPGPSRVGDALTGVLRSGAGWTDGSGPKDFRIELPIIAEGAGKPPGLQRAVEQRVWVLLVFAFLGGLLLNVMPCVFPVIGLKIMGFAKQAHKERRAVFFHGLAYAAGVLLCFWTLAFLVITMGRGWGAQLQSDWFMFFLCHLFVIMSMNMAGVFEVGTAVAGAGQANIGGREGLKRSFLTGLLATLTSTPCSAPFLGTALAYALSLPAVLSLGVFTLMGLGFSFPYLALSIVPGWLQRLPKPGPWMDTFRQFMAFPLFATTAYLFWTMEAMMDEWRFLMLLFGLVLTAMACWLYGKYQRRVSRRPATTRVLLACAGLALAGGVWLGLPKAGDQLEWKEWSPELVSRLREEGRAVYVDFTARWCATCQLNKRVYNDPSLRELILDKDVALLKADWTQYDERITSTLRNEFNKAAVPVNVLYPPGEERGDLLPDLLTVENVSELLRALP